MEALLRVEHLKKQFHRNSDGTYVLKDISFEMMPGECLGLIGNSGSGKSTIVKILKSSLNPKMTIGQNLDDALLYYRKIPKTERKRQCEEILERVHLPVSYLAKYPSQISGGECQRVCIARALLRHPALLICDEATSALDVSVQKEIVDLLKEIQQEEHMAMLFISHDLALVANVCDRILMLFDGEIKKIKCVPDEAQ